MRGAGSSSAASFWDWSAEVKLPRRASTGGYGFFEAGDLLLGVVETVFELFELDGVEALDGMAGSELVPAPRRRLISGFGSSTLHRRREGWATR